MSSEADLSIDVGTFSSKFTKEGSTMLFVLAGEADAAAIAALEVLLKRLDTHAATGKPKDVVLDVRKVTFMNSSCFTVLVAWVERVRGLADDARFRIRLKSNNELLWQRRSLHALKCFAADIITIES